MDIKQIQLNAYRLHQIIRAWCLHQTTAYDAWESNFTISEKFTTFLKNSKVKGTSENSSIRIAIGLNNVNLAIDKYIEFVIVTMQNSHEHLYYRRSVHALWSEYNLWIYRNNRNTCAVYKDVVLSFQDTHSTVPWIMEDINRGMLTPLEAAEVISTFDAWDKLWSLREQSIDFQFDLTWAQIHKYKPLFTKE